MAVHIVDNGEKKKQRQVNAVDGDGKKQYGKYSRFNHRFQRVKSVGCAWRRVGGPVMNQMKDFKQPGMMHQPVRPVKVSVVNDEHERKSGKEIKLSPLIHAGIVRGEGFDSGVFDKKERNKSKEQHGDKRTNHFTQIVICARKPRLNFFMAHPFSQQQIAGHKCDGRHNKIPGADIL